MLLMGVIKMTEEAVKNLKFGETVADGNGNKYTKTIGGWIYSTFSGQVCFIPEINEIIIPVNEKELEAKTKKTKVEK
jgi:hypothetical protein